LIGWANLQWPPSITHTISVTNRTDNAYGQVWIDGATNQPGATPGLRAQLGFGPQGTNPATDPGWMWVDASFNKDDGNNDEFVASLLPETTGVFDYTYRYSTTNGRDWFYAVNGPNNSSSPFGQLTVNGELNKLANNVSFGHGILAGIHWRTDTSSSIQLGEAVAISMLQDRAATYAEKFTVNLTKIDGSTATISNQ